MPDVHVCIVFLTKLISEFSVKANGIVVYTIITATNSVTVFFIACIVAVSMSKGIEVHIGFICEAASIVHLPYECIVIDHDRGYHEYMCYITIPLNSENAPIEVATVIGPIKWTDKALFSKLNVLKTEA